MADLSRRQLVVCALGAVLAVVLGVRQLGIGDAAAGGGGDPAPAIRIAADGGGQPARVLVHVAGAVRRPGVYALRTGDRVDDAVRRAGGATPKADLGGLNLAAEVEDGRQVLVPVRVGAGAAGAAASAAASAAAPAEGQPLNVNTATLEQLDGLTGVGPITAQKILDAREERGGFGSIEELGEIPGIGEKRLATLREEVTL
jgi:competence protein ComEA